MDAGGSVSLADSRRRSFPVETYGTRRGGGDTTKYGWDKDVWELYDLSTDFNERVDLARKYPEKLAALKAQFDADAGRYHVYPFIDWDDVLKRRIHNNVPLKGFAKQ